MRRTAEEAEETRIALIETGTLSLAETGYHAARLDDVAERAGVSRGAVYHHFGDKRGLLAAIIARFIQAFDRSVDSAMTGVDRQGSVVQLLGRLIVEPLVLVRSDRCVVVFLELVLLKASGVSELDSVRAHRRELMNVRIRLLSDALRDGARTGRVRDDIDTDAVARHVASVQYGVLATWIEFGRTRAGRRRGF